MGIHTLLTVFRLFPHTFHNVVFASVGIVNSKFFNEESGPESGISALERRTERSLASYVDLAQGLGIPARAAFRVGTDVVSEASDLCLEISREFSGAVFFGSEIVFQDPKWYHRFLHNETAYAIQRQLRFAGLSVVILPILLFEKPDPGREEGFREILTYRGVSHHEPEESSPDDPSQDA